MTVLNLTTLTPYATLSAAIAASAPGDALRLTPGAYVEDFPDITHSLSIGAVGGMASLTRATPLTESGRAILNVPRGRGVDLSISHLEIHGAARPGPHPNGAAILFESGNGLLSIADSWIHHNEDGLLAGSTAPGSPATGMRVAITRSEFSSNGAPVGSLYAENGHDHNIYVGYIASLSVTDSYIHSAFSQGHEIKSRAFATTIANNRIFDLSPGVAGALGSSYLIDVPDGGEVLIENNLLEKGALSVNRFAIHFGGEGTHPRNSLRVCGNTLVNNRDGMTMVFNHLDAGGANIPAVICDNVIFDIGGGAAVAQDSFGPLVDRLSGNTIVATGAPPLDTTPLFAVPEPAGAAVMLAAVACLALARLRGQRRARPRMKPAFQRA